MKERANCNLQTKSILFSIVCKDIIGIVGYFCAAQWLDTNVERRPCLFRIAVNCGNRELAERNKSIFNRREFDVIVNWLPYDAMKDISSTRWYPTRQHPTTRKISFFFFQKSISKRSQCVAFRFSLRCTTNANHRIRSAVYSCLQASTSFILQYITNLRYKKLIQCPIQTNTHTQCGCDARLMRWQQRDESENGRRHEMSRVTQK